MRVAALVRQGADVITAFISILLNVAAASGVQIHAAFNPFEFVRREAANCEAELDSPPRLSTLARWFPAVGPAFRAAFEWQDVRGERQHVLLGRPKTALDDAPFFVLVPVGSPSDWPLLVINIDMAHVLVARAFRQEIQKLSGLMITLPRYAPSIEEGITYAARSQDILFFDRPGTRAVGVDAGLRLATEMAARLPIRAPALRPVRPD